MHYHLATPFSLYHATSDVSVDELTSKGLRCDTQRAGENELMRKVNIFLDQHAPNVATQAELSRQHNIYGYLGIDDLIINIEDGTHIPLQDFTKDSLKTIVELRCDPAYCYVSNLDALDAVKHALQDNASESVLLQLAGDYWRSIMPLSVFAIGDIRRPEVMITNDVPPSEIIALS